MYKIFLDGVEVATTATGGGTIPTQSDYIMANNSSGTAASFTDGYAKFAAKHMGLSTTKVSSLYTAITALQTSLGR